MKGRYPNSEATVRELQAAIDAAKHCDHKNTVEIVVDETTTARGTLIDSDTLSICTNYYCGEIVEFAV